MSNATVRKSSWIVTLSLAAISIAYLTLVWLPSRREIRAIREQVQTKRQYVARATGLAKTLTASQKELEVAEAANQKWQETAPRNRDLPALYGRINALAKEAGLVVARFDPEPFTVHEEIREIPLAIGCSGMFSQVFDYLMDIEMLPTAIWVDSLRIEKMNGTKENVKCELNLVVFSDNPYSSDCIIQTK